MTTLSSDYQVVIPKAMRDELGIKAGHRFSIISKGGVIELVPLRTLDEVRGMFRGADPSGFRDRTDRV